LTTFTGLAGPVGGNVCASIQGAAHRLAQRARSFAMDYTQHGQAGQEGGVKPSLKLYLGFLGGQAA
jgi:hypothetical protein